MSMEKVAFKMHLHPDQRDEYKRRHDEIWTELSDALTKAGVKDYSIHFDPATNILFATMWRRTDHGLDALSKTEIMRKWWSHMADIMETDAENVPVSTDLECLFHME